MAGEVKSQAYDATPATGGPGRRTFPRPTAPRLPLMEVSALTQNQRVLANIGASNVLRMLAHREDLLAVWLDFGTSLTNKGRLPMRTRELLILRVALRTSCEYEWANHVPGALSAGVPPAEIASLTNLTPLTPGACSWSAAEAAALALVDDLCADDCASEQTWNALTAAYDEGEIVELLMLVGFYRMNAGLLNSLGVPAEPGRPRLGQGTSYAAPMPAQRPASASTADALREAKPAGTWHLKFYHPAITQELRLVLVMQEGEQSGSMTNETAGGLTVPIAEGKLQGHQVAFKVVMTQPLQVTTTWDGTIDGDSIAGTVDVSGMGTFPFDGTRIEGM